MLRAIATGLIVTALVGGPTIAQPSGSASPTATTTTKPGSSVTKSVSRLKRTNTTRTEKGAGKPVARRKLRRPAVYRGGHPHLIGRRSTLKPHRRSAARVTGIKANESDKASKSDFKAAGDIKAQK